MIEPNGLIEDEAALTMKRGASVDHSLTMSIAISLKRIADAHGTHETEAPHFEMPPTQTEVLLHEMSETLLACRRYLTSFGSEDPTALVVRIDRLLDR